MPSERAIGLFETRGVVGLTAGIEAMMKTADVECVAVERVSSGYFAAAIQGSIAAVRQAMEAGSEAVRRYGDPQVGAKFGVAMRLGDSKWSFNPAIGFAGNLEEGSRSAGLVDLPIAYNFVKGTHLGSGLSFYDFTHKDIRTFSWLGEAGFPVWKNDEKKHQLDFQVEWRQFFDRGSDPDTNYQFWGGLRYLFK